jgi:hypothetical protein
MAPPETVYNFTWKALIKRARETPKSAGRPIAQLLTNKSNCRIAGQPNLLPGRFSPSPGGRFSMTAPFT